MAKTKTQGLQEYCDEIYGQGFYLVEYEPFRGFYAVSQDKDTPPHSQFLGYTSDHAHSHLDEMAWLMENRGGN
jgi:hypothetical protein